MKNNVLLIVLDCARYDLLFENKKAKHSYIQKLAKEGTVFHNAYAVSCWTPPTHTTLFTGLYPPEHGVVAESPLTGHKTVAEIFKEKGHYTFMISPSTHISEKRNLDRGFEDKVECYGFRGLDKKEVKKITKKIGSEKHARIKIAVRKMFEFLETTKTQNKSFFGFINLITTHAPYKPPKAYQSPELIELESTLSKKEKEKIDQLCHNEAYKFMTKKVEITKKEWRIMRLRYESEMNFNDYLIDEIIKKLKSLNLYDNTKIILTADHGESFGTHGLSFHQFGVYNELTHIQLIIKNGDPKEENKLISQVNITQHILNTNEENEHKEIYMIYAPSPYVINLIQKHGGKKEDFTNKILAIQTEKWKLIINSERIDELYNIIEDPNEKRNLIKKDQETVKKLKTKIIKRFPNFLGEIRHEDYEKYTKKMKESLKNLGYF